MYGYKGQQQQEKTPIPGPWRHGTIENFLKARDAGSSEIDDADVSVDALVRSLPAAAAAGVAGIDPDESVDAAVVVTQTSPIVRRYAKAFGRAMAHVITTGEKANIVAPEDDDGDLRELLETVKDVAGGGEASAGSEEDGFVDSVQTLRTKLPAYAEASPFKIIA